MQMSDYMKKNNKISVVIPCYNCADLLVELHRRLVLCLAQITEEFEIIFVNDASPERDWQIIEELAGKDSRVIGINLSRNFGQHYAITAGLDYCNGDWIVVMDGDLQDKPEEIKKLFEKASSGYEIVVGKRENRRDSLIVRMTSKLFYMVFNYLTGQKFDNKVANFGIYSKRVIDNVRKLKEADRSFGLLVSLVGFSKLEIEVEHANRTSGKSAYSFKSRLNLAFDHILSHSNKPLILSIQVGFIISSLSLLYAFWLIIRYFISSHVADGWTSLMVSLFFLSGLIIVVAGMVGLYVGKIYNEVKNRPLYIVKEITKNSKE
ncbi:MAG: glycosyltransferase family 2 protein [Syntrophaceae bacterium]|nr:glycosyltransferase family 2 protein [Syntrophaceae bacterium]